jgi:hypothetical protein
MLGKEYRLCFWGRKISIFLSQSSVLFAGVWQKSWVKYHKNTGWGKTWRLPLFIDFSVKNSACDTLHLGKGNALWVVFVGKATQLAHRRMVSNNHN